MTSLAVFRKLGLGATKPTTIRLLVVDHSIKKTLGVLYDVFVKVGHFIFPSNFVILNCEIDYEVLIILGSLFFATKWALVNIECGEIKF